MQANILDKFSFGPLLDRVIVIPEERETVTKSGFVKADNTTGEDIISIGKVLKVGPGRFSEAGKRIPMEIKEGDRVIFGRHSGDDVLLREDGKLEMYRGKVLTGTVAIKILRIDAILTVISQL